MRSTSQPSPRLMVKTNFKPHAGLWGLCHPGGMIGARSPRPAMQCPWQRRRCIGGGGGRRHVSTAPRGQGLGSNSCLLQRFMRLTVVFVSAPRVGRARNAAGGCTEGSSNARRVRLGWPRVQHFLRLKRGFKVPARSILSQRCRRGRQVWAAATNPADRSLVGRNRRP